MARSNYSQNGDSWFKKSWKSLGDALAWAYGETGKLLNNDWPDALAKLDLPKPEGVMGDVVGGVEGAIKWAGQKIILPLFQGSHNAVGFVSGVTASVASEGLERAQTFFNGNNANGQTIQKDEEQRQDSTAPPSASLDIDVPTPPENLPNLKLTSNGRDR